MAENHAREERALLRDSVRDALAAGARLDDLGLWSTLTPPDGSLALAMVVAEELGRGRYAGPAYEVMVGDLVAAELGVGADAAFVTGDAAGATDPAVAVASERLLLIATGDTLAGACAADARVIESPSLDVTRRTVRYTVTDAEPIAVQTDTVRRARASRSLLYAADTLGCIEHVLDKTVDYAKQRTTFGAPIGKYQAVAHRLVDHTITTRQLRLLLDDAAASFDTRDDALALCLATAETFLWGRGTEIISDCIQLCGGIGFTWEWGHHLYLRRAVQNGTLGMGCGRPRRRLAEAVGW